LNDAVANATLIAEELAAADATISSLVGKLTGATKKSAKALGKGLREARASGADVVKLREVYLAMIQLREELKNLELDLEWER